MAKLQSSLQGLTRLSLVVSFSFSVLAACAGGPQIITPGPKPSAGALATPPPIPEFPAQPLPTAVPGNAGGGRLAPGAAEMAAPSMSAPMADSGGGSGGASSDSVGKTTRPAAPPTDIGIMPPIRPEPQIQPEAGLLTAGAWDDLSNWSFWLNLLQNQEWSAAIKPWGLDTSRRVGVLVTGPDGPLADVPVQLLAEGSASPVYEARSNTRGEAWLFAGLTSPVQGNLSVKANLGQDSPSQPVDLSSDAAIKLELDVRLEPAVNADLMLVVDTTGSMGDEMEYLKKELANVAERIVSLNRQDLSLRLSVNFYKDSTDEYIVRPFPFSEDIQTVVRQLAEQSANGGGDFPEAVDVALADAVDEHRWSPTARARLLFLVLDAPSHQTPEALKRLHTSVIRAAAKGIRIIPVASSGIDKETEFELRQLAIATGGRYLFLTDDSGIGGGHIEPTIGQFTVKKLNDLMVEVATDYIKGEDRSTSPAPSRPPSPEPSLQPSQDPQQ
ncbi:MAG: VWA domain-containing protein [Candidatus Melainabacteria bacterium HGW-Melainabacteria-1]|nr:MAG: VWA domain-containing protein [Candidatus Melainabacteria bacterium HGW-Melainabacteria-1]